MPGEADRGDERDGRLGAAGVGLGYFQVPRRAERVVQHPRAAQFDHHLA
jgi:hypothetical protein